MARTAVAMRRCLMFLILAFALPLSEQNYQYGWSKWSDWSEYTACPVTCGSSVQIRERSQSPCRAIAMGAIAIAGHCKGPANEIDVKACGTTLCEPKKHCWEAHYNSKINSAGGHIRDFYDVETQEGCQDKCEQEPGCCSMSIKGKGCWLHKFGPVMSNKAGYTAITNVCHPCTYVRGKGHPLQQHVATHAQCQKPYNKFTEATRIMTFQGTAKSWDYVNQNGNWKTSKDWRGPGWYRFTGGAGTHMAESAPSKEKSCGTPHPLWLKNGHPTVAEGIVQRTTCAYVRGNPCSSSYGTQISIVNCNGYYLYHLKRNSRAVSVYCGSNA